MLSESTNKQAPSLSAMDGKILKDPTFKDGTLDTFDLSSSDISKGSTQKRKQPAPLKINAFSLNIDSSAEKEHLSKAARTRDQKA